MDVFVIQGDATPTNPPFVCSRLPDFVELRGGDYFFLPSITALGMIALGLVILAKLPMTNDTQQSGPRIKRAWTVILAWIGGVSAVLGFIGALTGFFGNIQGHFHHDTQLDSEMPLHSRSRARAI